MRFASALNRPPNVAMQSCVESSTVIFLGRHATGGSSRPHLNKTMITGCIIKRAQSRGCCAAVLSLRVQRCSPLPLHVVQNAP